MLYRFLIIIFALLSVSSGPAYSAPTGKIIKFDFYGDSIEFLSENSFAPACADSVSQPGINLLCEQLISIDHSPVLRALQKYRDEYHPDDWLYYQLIRKTAQQLSPKGENYVRYTLCKWILLAKSGYDATLRLSGNKILLYVKSNDSVFNIALHNRDGMQYVCLNQHDYPTLDVLKEKITDVPQKIPRATNSFSFKITVLPDFNPASYSEKDISFNYFQADYHFKISLNPQVETIFKNYPVVDFNSFFNIPLSKKTYASLVPQIKQAVAKMSTKNGIDFLLHFTRYAFAYETDSEAYGGEKRLSPEETLLYKYSDCEDRAALFFFLVKEVYNLPMLTLVYPHHVTIAVQLQTPVGRSVFYNGKSYSICEPTPQSNDLRVGQGLKSLENTPYEIGYVYNPLRVN